MLNYYALVDGEKVVPLGPCASFDDADDRAPPCTNWIYDKEALQRLVASAKEALK